MEIKGVIFDLDHTLYDRYKTIQVGVEYFYSEFADKLSADISVEEVSRLMCEGDRRYIYHGWRRIFKYLCDEGLFVATPTYEEYKECMLRLYSKHAIPFSFTYSVLDELKERGLAIGLITNGRAEIQRAKLALLDLERYFDEIIVCGEFGIQKPSTEPFSEMSRRLSISAEHLLYVGDNPFNDVEASRNAGYTPIEVLTASCPMDNYTPAEHRIRTVEELPDLIDKL